MTVVGYSDKLSAFPGEKIKFMVSCDSVEYQADIVKLIHGDTNPDGPGFKEEFVQTGASGRYPGHQQEIHSGSYVVVQDSAGFQGLDAFALQAYIWPTTPAKGPQGEMKWCSSTGWCMSANGVSKGAQGIITKWNAASRSGYALVADEDGCVALWLGDGNGGVAKISSRAPLLAKCWYFVSTSYDRGRVVIQQEPIVGPANGRFSLPYPLDGTTARVEQTTTVRPSGAPGTPLLIAGWVELIENGMLVQGGKYNGKIDRPRLTSRPLARDEMDAPQGPHVIAAWDFAHGITRKGVATKKATDLSANGLHGCIVNQPARAVTGYNWTSQDMCFVHAPEQYGAIHFHDDDVADAGWEVDFELTVPDSIRSGLYAARLRAGEDEDEDYIPFYVRPKRGQEAKIAFLAPTASYMAYANDHLTTNAALAELLVARTPVMGANDLFLAEHREYGLSTYDTHSDGSGVCYSSRLRPILNMRPKYRHWLSPSLWQFNADLHLIDWLTEMGYEFDVVTDQDLNLEGVDLIKPYKVVLTGSHPEYYSNQMLDAVEAYQRGGGRFMYMGANGFYWVVSYDPNDPNIIEVRKGDGSNAWKALPGERHLSFNGEYGTLWRHRNRAPQKIAGTGFVAEGFDISSYYRRNPDSFDPRAAWIFEGIGEDELIGDFGLVGGGAAGLELDIYDQELGSPPHALVLASSEKHTDIYLEVLEELFFNVPGMSGTQNARVRADIVYYTTPNGGAVFSLSSIAFCGSLSHNNYDNNCSRMIANVVNRFLLDEAPPSTAEAAAVVAR
ncbi:MAG: N,N-dimethylformamidase [Thermoleophilia bacterium]|nr:N,N-dimethylformamidase [Thermoleophilia bacterium]